MGIREKVLWTALRRRIVADRPYVIAVGGGIAKTSTKQALGRILEAAFPGQVRIGYGNLNTFIGVPLAALGYRIDFHRQRLGALAWAWLLAGAWLKGRWGRLPKYLVLEYGTDRPGDIKYLVGQLLPDMALLTLVTEAHVANYGSMEAVAEDETALVVGLPETGIAVVNANDRHVKAVKDQIKAKLIEVKTELELISRNFAAAAARQLGVNEEKINDVLSQPTVVEGRFEIKQSAHYRIIDDSYNANPASMRAALNVLAKSPGKKIAILGSMLELGEQEKDLHRQVGEQARAVSDIVIGVGDLAKYYQPDVHFPDSAAAAKTIFSQLPSSGSILVKGSRGVRMEKVVEELIKQDGV